MEVKTIMTKQGKEMKLRLDTSRFFFPDEWKKFIKSISPKKRNLYEFILNTGSRFDEAIHIRPCDFDFERNNVRLWKTKTKAKKGETTGKPRTISLSSDFSKKMKKFCSDKAHEEYLFRISQPGVNQMIKRRLKDVGIKDWYNFTSHNLRKTHGMYLKALGIDIAEICTRLGHDYNTYIKHYGSADIFSEKDMRSIREILGDLYFRQRRF